MRAVKGLVAAAQKFPGLFEDFQIKCHPSQRPQKKPDLVDGLTALDNIVIRMLPKNDERVGGIQAALKSLDARFGIFRSLITRFEQFSPRVHAELILLEHFYQENIEFVQGDKYIGCSKPACYCCYHYIYAHPGRFVHPASSNKNYVNWWPPGMDGDPDGLAAKRRRNIMNKMIEKIRQDVLDQIETKRGPRAANHASTTGISESVVVNEPILDNFVPGEVVSESLGLDLFIIILMLSCLSHKRWMADRRVPHLRTTG